MKEGTNDQNLGTTLFTYARKGWKSLFCFSTHEETEVMAVCSHDVETVSSWILSLFVVKQGGRGNNLPINLSLNSWQTGWCNFQACAAIYVFVSYKCFS